ncbi:MAG TPA: GGDEF domain-containing protein [Dehalococcoidia bacterium]|jgi:diguanylate cyclase (GGDEF)-like protein|nr:GGDEF domain-containing protein [Dehalococcoidia bacterium]
MNDTRDHDTGEFEALSSPHRTTAGERTLLTVRIAGVFLIASIVAWTLFGDRLAGDGVYRSVQAASVLIGGGLAFVLSSIARNRMVEVERAYSAHLEALSLRLRGMAFRDSLTGLYTHRYFYDQLAHEVERSLRYGHPLSLLMIDLDRFKEMNDTYGHLMGDRLLKLVADTITRCVRGSDIVGRYGGDEFVVILPDTKPEEARAVADKLRAAVRGQQAWDLAPDRLGLSISVGVASCPEDARSVNELLQVADRRLYAQKPRKTRQRVPA